MKNKEHSGMYNAAIAALAVFFAGISLFSGMLMEFLTVLAFMAFAITALAALAQDMEIIESGRSRDLKHFFKLYLPVFLTCLAFTALACSLR